MNTNEFGKISIISVLITSLVFGLWFYAGWPQIWQKLSILPKVQEVQAQDGPPIIDNLVLRLDADAIEGLNDGDKVATWSDLSGEDHHFTQTIEDRRPTYKANIVSGKPIIRFSGGQALNSASVYDGSQSTMIAVAKHTSGAGYQSMVSIEKQIIYGYLNTANKWGTYNGKDVSSGQLLDDFKIASVVTRNFNDVDLVTNGEKVTQTNGTQFHVRPCLIGGYEPSMIQMFYGDIAEILVYNRVLSDAERENIEQYLGEKWLGWEPVESGFEMGSIDYRIWESSINVGGLDYQESERYRLRETIGEAIVGDAASPSYRLRSGYQPMLETYIAAAALPEGVIMSPSIGGITGGQSNGTTSIKVTTDSPSGYSLFVRALASPALSTSSYSFADYAPASSSVPDYDWSVPATTTGFGFTPYGSDTIAKYRYIGSTCDPEDSEGTADSDYCWYNFSTTDETIAASYLSNHPDGTETYIKFRAESGSQNIQSAGEYSATLIITVIPN